MPSGKLDQSLDEILKTSRNNKRNQRGGARGGPNRGPAHAAPVGGIQKSNKNKKALKGAPAVPVAPGAKTEPKLMISGLPRDLEQEEINNYFAQALGSKPKSVRMVHNEKGAFTGEITVFFHNQKQADKAAEKLDKVKIDNRPIRVEKFIRAADAAAAAAPNKSLADRVTHPKKDQPKPVTATKGSDTRGRGAKGRRGGRGGRFQRGPKKTVEELDAEMEDYFPADQNKGDEAMVTNGGAQAPGAGDAAMEDDEML